MEIELTPKKVELLKRLEELGSKLILVHTYKFIPSVDGEREEAILKKMKEVIAEMEK
jgi:hypothetical protein